VKASAEHIAEFYFRTYFLSAPASNGRNHQWSARCRRLLGRHSLQWCNSGSTFAERTAMPSWEMHLPPATGGLLWARAVQRRNSPMSKGQCPQRDASAAWRFHTTLVSRLRPILRQVFATHVCFSGGTAIPSYQKRSSVGMGVRRGSRFSSAERTLIYRRCARSFWSIPSIRSGLRYISGQDWHYFVSRPIANISKTLTASQRKALATIYALRNSSINMEESLF